MSYRKKQTESALVRAISQVLVRDISDPRIVGMVSVTRVDMSPDKRRAKVYVSIIPEQYTSKTFHGLRHAASHIYSKLCHVVAMRSVPRLEFCLDETLKKQAAVFEAISLGIEREDLANRHQGGEEVGASGLSGQDQDDMEGLSS